MKKALKNDLIILFSVLILIILAGCENNEKENNLLKEKTLNEIKYLDSKIVGMLNNINNISYQNYKVSTEEIELDKSSGESGEQTATSQVQGQKDKGEQGETQGESKETQTINKSEMSYSSILNTNGTQPNWDLIKSDIEVLHSTWNTIIMDLNLAEVSSESITNFDKELDNTTIAIKNENKSESIGGLARMYSFIPTFIEGSNKEDNTNIESVKMHVLNAYSFAETENWESMANEIVQAVSKFDTFKQNKNEKEKNSFNLRKAEITLRELQASVDLHDKDVFYIKYRNAIEQLSML